MTLDIQSLSLPLQIMIYVLVVAVLLTQGTLIFLSAKKRGANAWFWGLLGLLNIPSGAILYYLFVIWPEKRRRVK
ncbi:transcriptional regulator [Peribacillus faecalis]|nr:transcriptional regulator [Peribacillus faecalis]